MCKLGYKHTPETLAKISATSKGRKWSDENREKQRQRMLGVQRLLGYKHSKESLEKMSKSHLGSKRTLETRKKIGDAQRGEKNHQWKGGISNTPYTVDWTITLKRSIRERDGYQCMVCLNNQGDRAFSVHHIDYDKTNCNPNNLITLCPHCHTKTNSNRVFWEEYFGDIKRRNG